MSRRASRCSVDPSRKCGLDSTPAQGAGWSEELRSCALGGCDRATDHVLTLSYRVAERGARWLANPADFEDAVQRTVIQVNKNLHRFRGGSFSGWVGTIAVNEARQLQRRSRGVTMPATGLPPEETSGGRRMTTDLVNKQVFAAAVSQLGERDGSAFLLREHVGLSYQEIADQENIPLGTAKTRVRRARQRVAELIGRTDPDRTAGGGPT